MREREREREVRGCLMIVTVLVVLEIAMCVVMVVWCVNVCMCVRDPRWGISISIPLYLW